MFDADGPDDPVADFLLEELGSGGQHISAICNFCNVLQSTGRGGGAIDFMAEASAGGMCHAERNLHMRMKHLFGNGVTPYDIVLTLRDSEGSEKACTTSCFAPYEILSELTKHEPQLHKTLLGDRGTSGPAWFWGHVRRYRKHHIFDPDWANTRELRSLHAGVVGEERSAGDASGGATG